MATENKKIKNIVDTYANIKANMDSNQSAYSSDAPGTANIQIGTPVSRVNTEWIVEAVQAKIDVATDTVTPQDNYFGAVFTDKTTAEITAEADGKILPSKEWVLAEIGAQGLQEVTDIGSTTTNSITAAKNISTSGRFEGTTANDYVDVTSTRADIYVNGTQVFTSQTAAGITKVNNFLGTGGLQANASESKLYNNTHSIAADINNGVVSTNSTTEYNADGVGQVVLTKRIYQDLEALQTLQTVTDNGATTTNSITVPSMNFSTIDDTTPAVGDLKRNSEDTLRYGTASGFRLEVGRTLSSRFYASEAISKGEVITVPGLYGVGQVAVELATADSYNSNWVLGVAGNDAAIGEVVEFVQKGVIEGVNTSLLATDVPLYICDVPGQLVDTRPEFPCKPYIIGTVIIQDAVNGVIGVNVQQDLYDVQFDGCAIEKQDTSIRVDTGVIYCDMEKDGGGDLPVQISNQILELNCTTGGGLGGKATVALTAGTDTSPQENFVYVYNNAGVATLAATTTYPPVPFTWLANYSVWSATKTTSDGPASSRQITSSKANDGRGRIAYMIERMALDGAKYRSGCTPSSTISATPSATVDLTSIAGIVYQNNRQSWPQLQVSVDGIYVANGSGGSGLTNYTKYTNLVDLMGYVNTDTARDTNCRGHIVVFGCINEETNECKLYANLPSSLYGGTDTEAYKDYDSTGVRSVPDELQLTAFLIADVPYDYQGGNATAINPAGSPEIISLLGQPIGVSGSGSQAGAFIPTLQQVTDTGATTTNSITVDDTVNATFFKGATGSTITAFSNDGTLAGNSATEVPTEQAVKTYADAHINSTSNPHTVTLEQATAAGGTTSNQITSTARIEVSDDSTTEMIRVIGTGGSFPRVGLGHTASNRPEISFTSLTGNNGNIRQNDSGYITCNNLNTDYAGGDTALIVTKDILSNQLTAQDIEQILTNGSNANGQGLENLGTTGIGTTAPFDQVGVKGSTPTIRLSNSTINSVESGRVRLTETEDTMQGAYMHYDGSTNELHIGTHSVSDNSAVNDVDAITITRDTRVVTFPDLSTAEIAIESTGKVAVTREYNTIENTLIENSDANGQGVENLGDSGFGTDSPLAKVHISDGVITTSDWLTSGTGLIIAGIEAIEVLVATDQGTWGSAANYMQVDGTTKAFENSWSWIRKTNGDGLGDGSMHLKYGTNKETSGNTTMIEVSTDGVITAPTISTSEIATESTGKVLVTREYLEGAGGVTSGGAESSSANDTIADSTGLYVATGTTTQTVTLPAANALGSGVAQNISVKSLKTGGSCTLQRGGSDNLYLFGSSSATTNTGVAAGASLHLISDGGTNWFVLG